MLKFSTIKYHSCYPLVRTKIHEYFITFTKNVDMYGKPRKYTNGEITVFWRPSECIHATHCYRDLLKVFNPTKRPWINMNGATTEDIIKVVDMCPTDALTYKWNKDIEKEQNVSEIGRNTEQPTEVKVLKNGPVIIRGNLKIIGTDGKEMKKMKVVSICRCGKSKKLPYCDGSHIKTTLKN
jgi:uncharacterized Fe-S cluster protein YjdI